MNEDGSIDNRLLFDLFNDPMQRENLVKSRAEDAARLEALLSKWEAGLPEINGMMSAWYRNNYRRKHHMDVIGMS